MFGLKSRRRLGVAVAVVVATVGFAVGNASAADRHLPIHRHPIACPLWIAADGSRPKCSPIHRPILPVPTTVAPSGSTTTPTTPTTVKAPVTTIPKPVTTSTTEPTTVKVPTPVTIVGCPNPGPIRAIKSDAVTSHVMCPLATTNNTKVSGSKVSGAAAASPKSTEVKSDAEIGTACVITRDESGATISTGCDS